MEDSPVKNDKPEENIVIADCGEMGDEEVIEEKRQKDEYGDGYESHPSGTFFVRDCGFLNLLSDMLLSTRIRRRRGRARSGCGEENS